MQIDMKANHAVLEVAIHLRRYCCQVNIINTVVRVGTVAVSDMDAAIQGGKCVPSTIFQMPMEQLSLRIYLATGTAGINRNYWCGQVSRFTFSKVQVRCADGPLSGNYVQIYKENSPGLYTEEVDVLVEQDHSEWSSRLKTVFALSERKINLLFLSREPDNFGQQSSEGFGLRFGGGSRTHHRRQRRHSEPGRLLTARK